MRTLIILPLLLLAAAPASAETLRIAVPDLPYGEAAQPIEEWTDAVSEATDGRVRFDLQAQVGVSEEDLRALVERGEVDGAVFFTGAALRGFVPNLAAVGAPGLFATWDQARRLVVGIQDRYDEALLRSRFRSLVVFIHSRRLMFTKRSVASPRDLGGMHFAIDGPYADAFARAFAARAVELPLEEVPDRLPELSGFVAPFGPGLEREDSFRYALTNPALGGEAGALLVREDAFGRLGNDGAVILSMRNDLAEAMVAAWARAESARRVAEADVRWTDGELIEWQPALEALRQSLPPEHYPTVEVADLYDLTR